jgi:hypothetical protein
LTDPSAGDCPRGTLAWVTCCPPPSSASIVAIDRVPWPYFRREFAAEGLVKASGVGWSIVRATQFHQFIDAALTVAARLPVMVINPGVLAQPVDGREVADRFVDRIADAAAEPVLAAWGITTEGKPVFIGLDAAASESDDAWDGFLRDLGERGLARPLLVISDGSAGLIGTAERTMPSALRQRCLVHRARHRSDADRPAAQRGPA